MTTRKVPKILKWLYKKLIRPFVLKQIYNPNVVWDDKVIKFLDDLFQYSD